MKLLKDFYNQKIKIIKDNLPPLSGPYNLFVFPLMLSVVYWTCSNHLLRSL